MLMVLRLQLGLRAVAIVARAEDATRCARVEGSTRAGSTAFAIALAHAARVGTLLHVWRDAAWTAWTLVRIV